MNKKQLERKRLSKLVATVIIAGLLFMIRDWFHSVAVDEWAPYRLKEFAELINIKSYLPRTEWMAFILAIPVFAVLFFIAFIIMWLAK